MEKKIIDLETLTPTQLEAEDLLSQVTLMIHAEKYDDALELLQKAQTISPNEIDIYLRQAQIYIIKEDYPKANGMLDKASYLDRNDSRIYLHRGNILFLTEKFSECVEQYGLAEENGMKVAPMYENMGFAYERTGKVSQAIQAYGKAIRLDPDNPLYRYRRISLLLDQNEVDTASEMINDFLKRFPNIKEGYVIAVDVLFRKNQFADAEKLLIDVMASEGEDSELQALLIRAKALLSKRKEAISLGLKVLDSPEASEDAKNDVLKTLPRLYMLEGEVDKGLDLLKQVIASEKDNQYNIEARSLLVTLLAGLKRYKELLPIVEDILTKPALADKLYMVYMLKGVALKELGQSEEAMAAHRDALKKLRVISIRNPMAVDAHIFRAMCHQALCEYEEALSELKIVERLDVKTKEFYALRAAIYEAMGKKEEAANDRKMAES